MWLQNMPSRFVYELLIRTSKYGIRWNWPVTIQTNILIIRKLNNEITRKVLDTLSRSLKKPPREVFESDSVQVTWLSSLVSVKFVDEIDKLAKTITNP